MKPLDQKLGLMYCGGMEDMYREVLRLFWKLKDEKIADIKEAFRKEDWKNYRVFVHALKSSALNIGGEELSEAARKLEQAAKVLLDGESSPAEQAEQLGYIREHQEDLLEMYELVAREAGNILSAAGK